MYDINHEKPRNVEVNNVPIDSVKVLNVLYGNITISKFCELVGIQIPRFCFHPALKIAGNCRMCLIELRGSVKPVVACATTFKKGQAIYTNSTLVRMARESVLEFLLINHPLDCPICDQGGECDLQDISFTHGSDRGRFIEEKRAVTDLMIHPLIKTIMTRCIHCTRCVRYLDDVAGVPLIGTHGRGNSTEIGTYVNMLIHSEVIGNVVELCPVGALTSKPYAFLARPWELDHMESIDILDSLCSRIRIDTRGNTILRILPKYSYRANQMWISDRARFFYESVMRQRIMNPLINLNRLRYNDGNQSMHPFYRSSWIMAFSYITSVAHMCAWQRKSMLAFSSPLSDIYTTLALFGSFRSTGIGNGTMTVLSNAETDYREDYIIPVPEYNWTNKWMINHYFVYAGFNPRHDSPVLNIRLRAFHLKIKQQYGSSYSRVFIIGEAYSMNIKGLHDSRSDSSLREFALGLSTYSLACVEKAPVFLIGPSLALSGGRYNYRNLLNFILFNPLVHLIIHNFVPYTGDLSMFEWGCPVDIRDSAGIRSNQACADVSYLGNPIGLILIHDNDQIADLSIAKTMTMLPNHLVIANELDQPVIPILTSSKLPIFDFSDWESLLFKLQEKESSTDGLLFMEDPVVVYHGSNAGFGARAANLIIPSMTFFETMSHYISCSGEVLFTTTAVVISNNFPENALIFAIMRLFIHEYFPFLSTLSYTGLCKFLRSPFVSYDKYYRIFHVKINRHRLPPLLDVTPEQCDFFFRMRKAYGLDDEQRTLDFAQRFLHDENNPGLGRHEHDMLILRAYGGPYSWCRSLCYAEQYSICYNLLLEDIVDYNIKKYNLEIDKSRLFPDSYDSYNSQPRHSDRVIELE